MSPDKTLLHCGCKEKESFCHVLIQRNAGQNESPTPRDALHLSVLVGMESQAARHLAEVSCKQKGQLGWEMLNWLRKYHVESQPQSITSQLATKNCIVSTQWDNSIMNTNQLQRQAGNGSTSNALCEVKTAWHRRSHGM